MSDIREIPQAYSISTIRARGTDATNQRAQRRAPRDRDGKEGKQRKQRNEPFEDGHQLDEYI
jgi:hypothetical protein